MRHASVSETFRQEIFQLCLEECVGPRSCPREAMDHDITRAPGWRPPHCPNPQCRFHHRQSTAWRFRRHGFYQRQIRPYRIQRYLCLHCRRAFSSQTFSTSYWLKRPALLHDTYRHTVGGMANRQIARTVGCAPATIDRLLGRLGRHCLLFLRHLIQQASPFADIVIDGLVSFEHSQYCPFEHLAAVDRDTSFIIHYNDAPRRRSGRMTKAQQRRRQQLEETYGRPDPRAVEKAVGELLSTALAGADQAIVRSDEHRAYRRAMRGLECRIEHRRTSSRRRRDRHNELFEVNALDMFIRHSSANHRRETIAFSKRRQESAYRMAIFACWKNVGKWRWEKRCRQTPAMLLGLTDRVLTAEDVLARRLFPGHVELPASWDAYYRRAVLTPTLGRNRLHEARYAY
jgi:transposase-like protein